MQPELKMIGLGLVSAVTAPLCCIAFLWALVAESDCTASALSAHEPPVPYMIGITV